MQAHDRNGSVIEPGFTVWVESLGEPITQWHLGFVSRIVRDDEVEVSFPFGRALVASKLISTTLPPI